MMKMMQFLDQMRSASRFFFFLVRGGGGGGGGGVVKLGFYLWCESCLFADAAACG